MTGAEAGAEAGTQPGAQPGAQRGAQLAGQAGLDLRRNAVRADLADQRLEGLVAARRFVNGQRFQVATSSAPVRQSPRHDAALDTEALMGEAVRVFETVDHWSWVQLERDGYVGYVPRAALVPLDPAAPPPTHQVRALGTFIYPAADMKRPFRDHVSIGARVTVLEENDRFARIAGDASDDTERWVIRRHLASIDRPARDFVDIAERLIGTPYLWGGKTRLGLDCSGLVQIALDAAGILAPRDSDMQEAELGASILVPESLDGLIRGDFVFWRGHVGIMVDGILMVHANGHHMATVVEPLIEVAARIARTGLTGRPVPTTRTDSAVRSIKRLPSLTALQAIDVAA